MPHSPPPTGDPRRDRLIHLIAGELPAEEAATLRAWVDADPERRRVLAELEAIWRATGAPTGVSPEAWDAEAELRRIQTETGGTGRVIARVGPRFELDRFSRRSRIGTMLKAAAAAVLVIGGGLLWRGRGRSLPAAMSADHTEMEYHTAPGQRLALGLPDGTRVILAPGSRLRRSAAYGMRNRNVYLDGEAYFVVTHDASRPFTVYTTHVVARDLGTRFVVRAYADEVPMDIVVSEGSVAVARMTRSPADVHSAGDSLVLRPGQRARFTSEGTLAFSDTVVLAPYFDWTSGQLAFQRTPLLDVVRQLQRWYGIDIALADSTLRSAHLTATLHEESAAEALDLVATSLKLSVTRVGQTYILARAER